jgi:hypothetical protein
LVVLMSIITIEQGTGLVCVTNFISRLFMSGG